MGGSSLEGMRDLIVSLVIIWQILESLYSVMQVVHGGYISFNMYADCEGGIPVASMSIPGINEAVEMLKRLDWTELTVAQKIMCADKTL